MGTFSPSNQSHLHPSGLQKYLNSQASVSHLNIHTVKWTVRREVNHEPAANQRLSPIDEVINRTTENHLYATLQTRGAPHYELPDTLYETNGIDYTVIYEDPTSPSYVV